MPALETDDVKMEDVAAVASAVTELCRLLNAVSTLCSAVCWFVSVVNCAWSELSGSAAILSERLRTCWRLDAKLLTPLKPGIATVTGEVIDEDIFLFCAGGVRLCVPRRHSCDQLFEQSKHGLR